MIERFTATLFATAVLAGPVAAPFSDDVVIGF